MLNRKTLSFCSAIAVTALVVLGTQAAFAAPPVVKTVPWVANNPLIPHDTWSGKSIRLKGTCDSQGANFRYTWDFGDASPVVTGTVTNKFIIEASHAYTGAVDHVYTATLTVQNTTTGDTGSQKYYVQMRAPSLAVAVNVAIDEGLWYLHKDMRRDGSAGAGKGDWIGDSAPSGAADYASQGYLANTASNLNAFFSNGHLENGPDTNPYTETVRRGMLRLFEGLTAYAFTAAELTQSYPAPIGNQNPDTNGNGLYVAIAGGSFDATYPPYQGGMVIDAIVASGTPDAVTSTGPANVNGRSYKTIVQDMVDAYAFGQGHAGTYYGGWRYGWNYGCNSCNTDNSTNQWAAIGLIAAERVKGKGPDGILGTPDDIIWAVVPSWVKQANINSINTTQGAPGWDAGYFKYSPTDYPNGPPSGWGPWATTPSGMVQMAMDGIGRGDVRWDRTENFVRNNFCNTGAYSAAIRSYYYGLFSFTKSMLLHDSDGDGSAEPITLLSNRPSGANGLDWYAAESSNSDQCDGVARTLVNSQSANGYWTGHGYSIHHDFETAWAVIMLNRTVFTSGVPVAVAKASPNPAVAGQIIQLDGSDSFHQDGSKLIDSWEWDLDNNGSYETSGPFPTVSFPAVGNYPIKLRVTDNGSPELSAITTFTALVTTPPIAPTAKAGGPYAFCPGSKPWFLDGSGSVNPDDGQHEPGPYPGDKIVKYEWDLDGDGQYDDALGAQPDVTAFFAAKGPGSYLIQLKVTDRTATSFPSSGFGDLSDTDSAVVVVLASTDPACRCVNDLAARAKPGKVQLTWTHTGAHHYNIYRGTISGGPYLKIASTTSTYSTYLDVAVVNGTTYYYVVREADFLDKERCQSNQASARPTTR